MEKLKNSEDTSFTFNKFIKVRSAKKVNIRAKISPKPSVLKNSLISGKIVIKYIIPVSLVSDITSELSGSNISKLSDKKNKYSANSCTYFRYCIGNAN